MRRSVVFGIVGVAAAAASIGTTVARPDGGDGAVALDGAALFTAKGCASCHDGPDSTAMTGVGPSLADAPSWAGDRVEGLAAADYLEQSMRSPSAVISPAWRGPSGPSSGMPLLQLSDAEIEALVDYLLGRTAGAA